MSQLYQQLQQMFQEAEKCPDDDITIDELLCLVHHNLAIIDLLKAYEPRVRVHAPSQIFTQLHNNSEKEQNIVVPYKPRGAQDRYLPLEKPKIFNYERIEQNQLKSWQVEAIAEEFNRIENGFGKARIDMLVKRLISQEVVKEEISQFFRIERIPVSLKITICRLQKYVKLFNEEDQEVKDLHNYRFQQLYQPVQKRTLSHLQEQELKCMFDTIHSDVNGESDVDELTDAFQRVYNHVQELHDMISHHNTNGYLSFSFEEFVEFITP